MAVKAQASKREVVLAVSESDQQVKALDQLDLEKVLAYHAAYHAASLHDWDVAPLKLHQFSLLTLPDQAVAAGADFQGVFESF